MSAFTGTQGTPQLFKYLYLNDGWKDLVMLRHPWLSMVPKGDAATGYGNQAGASGTLQSGGQTGIVFTWNYSNPQSASLSHGAALLQQDVLTQGTQLQCQLSNAYSYLRFNAKDLAASQNNLASYMGTKRFNFDKAIQELSQQVDLALHRTGNGIIGTISDVTGSVITVANTTAMQQYQTNMRIISCSSNPTDGTAPTIASGSAVVTKVQQTYVNGQITVKLTVDNPAGFDSTTNKYFAKVGNALGFNSLNPEGNIIGFGNWIPTSSPATTDNFLSSINRSQDEVRLSGFRMSAGGRKYQEAVAEANAFCSSMGGSPDIILANPLDLQKASIELGANATYNEFKIGNAGFDSIVMGGPSGGKLRWVGDPNQDVGTLRGMTLDTWKVFHMKALPHPVDEDGLLLRKDAGSDTFQLALRAWPQQICFEPYANWVVTGF